MQIHPGSTLIYSDIQKSDIAIFRHKIKIRIQFDYSPKVVIDFGDFSSEPYTVVVKDSNGNVIYTSNIVTGHFAMAYRRWICDMDILVYDRNVNLCASFNLYNKIKTGKVLIRIESSSLGDTLAWVPYVNEFAKFHKCSDITVTTFWNHLFSGKYPDINFRHPGFHENGTDVLIGVGWYIEDDVNYHRKDPRSCNLQEVCSDILGINYGGEIKPIINFSPSDRPIEDKYVCIATQSTAGCKVWSRPNAWQELSDELISRGYKVVNISKNGETFNGVLNLNDESSLLKTMNYIHHCEFLVGLSSGLSWLSWALGKHVVMISNFTNENNEFSSGCTRIVNKEVCNSCWNDTSHKFDRSWDWCPRHLGTERHFECHREISPSMVLSKIQNLLS